LRLRRGPSTKEAVDRVIKAQGEKIDWLAREVDELRAHLARLEQAAR